MENKEDTEVNRVQAALQTWTAIVLQEQFILKSVGWAYEREHLTVWFERRK